MAVGESSEDNFYEDEDAFITGNENVLHEEILEDSNPPDDLQAEESDFEESENFEEPDELFDVKDDSVVNLKYHTDSVYAVRVREDENHIFIVAGSGDDSGSLIKLSKDVLQGKNESTTIDTPDKLYKDHNESVSAVGFNFDNSYIATAALDGSFALHHLPSATTTPLFGPTDAIEWLDWHPRGNVVVCGSADGTCWMWNTKGDCLNVFSGHEGPVSCGRFSPDGKLLVTASHDGSVKVWNPSQGSTQLTIQSELYHKAPILSMDCQESSPVVVTGGDDGCLRLANYSTGKILHSFEDHSASVEGVQFCPIIPAFASVAMDGLLKVWDMNSGQLRSTVLAHDGGIVKLKTHATEPLLYTCGVDCVVRVWDARTSACVRSFSGHTKNILDFDITKDGRTIVTSSDDLSIRVFRF